MNKKSLFVIIFATFVMSVAAQFSTHQLDFVKGADVGFLTGQEKRGVVFHDRNGKERECLELLKNDYQMGAIRMRVWVDPRGGTNDKHELLAMAKRVKALGMDLMVDFHYSDSWADPAKQPIPKAWLGHSYEEMKHDLRTHTIDVLTLLKDNGITPRWVQVGNETTNGMLWSVKTNERGWEVKDSLGHTTITHSMGHIKTQPEQYAGFIRTGYDAVKEVFPEAIVIVHLDRGHRQSLYDWHLDTLLKHGGKFDMIGMSLYPYWVLVVAFDMSLEYSRLCRASWWASQGIPYVATNPDRVCPTDQRTVLVDCGSMCKCIEHATGRQPDVCVGKPDPNMLRGVFERYGYKPEEVAMVGDRIYTDTATAHNAGAFGVLVLSGETTLEVAEKVAEDARNNPAPEFFPPDLIVRDVKELGELLLANR